MGWRKKLAATAGGLVVALTAVEVALWIADVPRFHRAHSAPEQFRFVQEPDSGRYFWVNKPGTRIEFEYDSDPRGYFEPGNIVRHTVNAEGFRGDAFRAPAPRTLRLAFFGDSFTFGEGVHDGDTFAEVTARLLDEHYEQNRVRVESYNFGVSGYNTRDCQFLLEIVAAQAKPHAVVLCYVLNDAEPALFRIDPARQAPVRRSRELEVDEGSDDPRPPDDSIYSLRLARLTWQVAASRERSQRTIAHYRDLYGPSAAGWQTTQGALSKMGAFLGERGIPFYVMIFPILFELDGGYPFEELHELVAGHATASGAGVLDLLPAFASHSGPELWVHPTDQHPNEQAHAIAAEQLARFLIANEGFAKVISALR